VNLWFDKESQQYTESLESSIIDFSRRVS
jgi:hypothetical protein